MTAPPATARSLADRYSHLAVRIDMPGDWPSLIEPWAPSSPKGLGEMLDGSPAIDEQLRDSGDRMIAQRKARGANLFDGPVAALGQAQAGQLTMLRSGYVNSMVSSETLAEEWEAGGDTPLRDRIDQIAGDPLRNGAGRSSALSVGALMVYEGENGPEFALGRRSDKVAIYPGMWHITPAGIADPTVTPPIMGTLAMEMREEVVLDDGEGERAAAGASVLGLTFDLLRLRLEVCCMVIVTGTRPVLDEEEHADIQWWPFTEEGLGSALELHGPQGLVPPGAGALELARWRLQTT